MERRSVRNCKRVMCLECGCNQPANSHGGGLTVLPDGTTSHMTTAEMITEK
jgi:hypothetical protein